MPHLIGALLVALGVMASEGGGVDEAWDQALCPDADPFSPYDYARSALEVRNAQTAALFEALPDARVAAFCRAWRQIDLKGEFMRIFLVNLLPPHREDLVDASEAG